MVQIPEKKKQLGLLGGTFDPVHNGHLAVAHHVMQTLRFDEIWFIPASVPPHKEGHGGGREISSFTQRIAMLERAVSQYPAYVISDIEARRSAPSYSIDTIQILLRQTGGQADLFFIIGADAFVEIATWKRYEELPTLISFVIISRPGFPPGKVEKVIRNSFAGYEYDPGRAVWTSRHTRGAFILQHMDPVPISSTAIRMKVKRGKNIAGLVPPAVADYIRQQKLYV